MSVKGQNTKSIRKKSLPNTRLLVVGTQNFKVHHAPSIIGSAYIDLTNLEVPIGLSNPAPTTIAKMRLKDFSNNWFLTSNLRPMWMEGISFEIVSNSTIRLLSGYESLEDEVFTIQYFNHTINGTVIADVRTPNASGTLLEGQTDFNLGEALPIKELSSQWPIQVYRGTVGTPMLRNANNAAYTGDDSIGNYEMVDRGDGYCQVIRFNIAGDVGGEPVFWANHGALGERPDLSVLQRVDKIHGIMDKMREDLLAVTGNDVEDPTRYDEGVPTQSDLKSFGDIVGKLNLFYDVAQKLSEFTKTKIQIKHQPSHVTVGGVLSTLSFNNLIVGKKYKLTAQVLGDHNGAAGSVNLGITWTNSAVIVGRVYNKDTSGQEEWTGNVISTFTATHPTLTATFIRVGGRLLGDGTKQHTYAELEELPNHEETTQWT